jgi:hypothetical protein
VLGDVLLLGHTYGNHACDKMMLRSITNIAGNKMLRSRENYQDVKLRFNAYQNQKLQINAYSHLPLEINAQLSLLILIDVIPNHFPLIDPNPFPNYISLTEVSNLRI